MFKSLSFVSANLTRPAAVGAFRFFCATRFSLRSGVAGTGLPYPAVPSHKFPAFCGQFHAPDAFSIGSVFLQPPPVSALRNLWQQVTFVVQIYDEPPSAVTSTL